MLAWVRVCYIRAFLSDWTCRELTRVPALSNVEDEWRKLSVKGANPIRVIALAEVMARDMYPYSAAKHLTSSFHSQVKFLAKKGKLLLGFAFYLEEMKRSKRCLVLSKTTVEQKDPIDFEIMGASDFGVSTVPYLGWFLGMFGFKKRALAFLQIANEELEKNMKQPGNVRPKPITAGLIWAKLYALTGHDHYKEWVKSSELDRHMDQDALRRIAKHLGFKSREELYKFCTI